MPFAARRTQGPESLRLKRALTLLVAVPAGVASRRRRPRQRNPPTIPCSISRANCRRRANPTCAWRRARPSCARPNTRSSRRMRPPMPNAPAALARCASRTCTRDRRRSRAAGQGDFAGAAKAYRSAHACRPRDAQILAALAGVLFDARDYAGAREAINASLAIDPRCRELPIASRATSTSSKSAGRTPSRASAMSPPAIRTACRPDTVSSCSGWRRCAPASPSPNSSNARPAKDGRSRCCCTCAANTPKPSSSIPIRRRRRRRQFTAQHQHRRAAVRGVVLCRRSVLGARAARGGARLLRGAGEHQGDLLPRARPGAGGDREAADALRGNDGPAPYC